MIKLLLCLMAAATADAQPRAQFEVATVKPVAARTAVTGNGERGQGPGCPLSYKVDRGRVDIQCAGLPSLIGYAFRFPPERIAGPDWLMSPGSPRFMIAAKLPDGASEQQVPEMLQALLADRFHLAIHHGTTVRESYALVVMKGGPKLQPATDAPSRPDAPLTAIAPAGETEERTIPNADGNGSTTVLFNPRMGTVRQTEGRYGPQHWEAPATTLAGLADLLDRMMPVSSPVVDATGIEGRYRVELDVSMKDAIGAGPADLEGVVLESFNSGLRKLGLHLERRKGPITAIIVDRVDKLPTEN